MGKRRFLTPVETAVLAALILALVLWMVWPKRPGAQIVVTRSGEELSRCDLAAPVRVPVQGAHGFSLTLVVEAGAAHVEDSTCPDLICQHHKPISRAGESIICLPGQVTITVEGGEGRGQDALSG